ncbi:MAG TPA: hypothetical protein VF765_26710 [Polyangiaceae bacterium]
MLSTGTIRVPAERRVVALDSLLLSSRVDAVLAREGYRFVGDLDGLTFGALARLPGLGPRGVAELRARLLELGVVDLPSLPSTSRQSHEPLDPKQQRKCVIRVPVALRELQFDGLSLSTRLINALRASGWHRVGDLDGVRMSDIANRYGFGALTLAELHDLLASHGAIEEPRACADRMATRGKSYRWVSCDDPARMRSSAPPPR